MQVQGRAVILQWGSMEDYVPPASVGTSFGADITSVPFMLLTSQVEIRLNYADVD
jgi:hypothetical protein